MTISKTCLLCGSSYEIKSSAANKSKYCSKVCHSKSKERKVIKLCKECGKEFSVPFCHQDRKDRCSRTCIKKFRSTLMTSLIRDTDWMSRSRKGQATRRYYKDIPMRSGWEVTFAKHLDSLGLHWKYEPQVFPLPNGRSYIPDFYVEEWGTFVEIRPTWRLDVGREKRNAFEQAGNPLRMITDEDIFSLQEIVA